MANVLLPFDHFHIDSVEDFRAKAGQAGHRLPVSEDLDLLRQPITAGGRTFHNALAVQPLEGIDAREDGSPSELTLARYEKWAAQGAGIFWVEATAVCPEGRDSLRQPWLHEGSVAGFARLAQCIDAAAVAAGHQAPYKILQLTHSGRCSVDGAGNPAPMAAFTSPYLDPVMGTPQIVTDAYLDQLQLQVVKAAALAADAGFQAVELKLCHQYLLKELLCAYTRPGKYGGSQENRFRFALETVDKIRAQLGERIDVVVRMNAYDGIPWPYGWGMQPAGSSISNWQGNPSPLQISEAEKSNWEGNPAPRSVLEWEKSNWGGNPRFERAMDAERSPWQGNAAFGQISAQERSNWDGNPAPLQVSAEEKSSWQGNPGRQAIDGTAPSNWGGNPVFDRRDLKQGSQVTPAAAGPMQIDLSEGKELMRQLYQKGIRLFNVSTNSPRFAPTGNGYMDNFREDAQVDPYAGAMALLQATKELRQALPRDAKIVGTGLSWFGPFGPHVAAGGIQQGWFDIAGFGRSVMADNDFLPSILRGQRPNPEKSCMGCDSCFKLFFAGLPTGCAIHHQAYKDLFKQALAEGKIGSNVIY